MTWVFIALGAAVGAPARYLTDRAFRSRWDTAFPWGTFTVNVIACLVLGVLTGAAGHVSSQLQLVLGTGLCGALSTYSTFAYETMRLADDWRRSAALGNVLGSLVVGLGAAALGWWLGTALS
jgi:CrcB protein